MTKNIRHVREHAKKHEKDQLHLKSLLGKKVDSEKILGWFLATFVITLTTVIIFLNWETITSFFSAPQKTFPEKVNEQVEDPKEAQVDVKGYEIGLETSLLVNGQRTNETLKKINNLNVSGFDTGLKLAEALRHGGQKSTEAQDESFLKSITLATQLGHGDHLTKGETNGGNMIQKTLLTSYYLGEKTNLIQSALENDAKLLSQISNTLKVDLFAYLNQSSSRADSLDAYLNLLETLQAKAIERSSELQSQINFLNSNLKAQENTLKTTEKDFFDSLEMFDGSDADQKLTQFIGLQQTQSEARAKAGAYQKLKDYYDFFLPKLDVMIRAIQANRGPLVAGVRVVEIEDMQLELIIPEK